MALNYQFYNNTLEDVKREIKRRQDVYWPDGTVNNAALEWNYQKTAYIILKSIKVDYDPKTKKTVVNINDAAPVKRIKTPSAPILELYGPDYTNSTGTIRGAILNSAEITSDGTVGKYGSILRITVNFTVFDKNELDNYMNSFLRPGADIGLEYGWTVNELEGNKGDKDGRDKVYVNKGEIRGTVFNFSFSAKEDGTWDCTLHAYGPSMMTYGFNTDAKDSENANPDPTNYATYGLMEIFRAVQENVATLYNNGDVVTQYCKKIWAGQLTGYLNTGLGIQFQNQKRTFDVKKGPVFYIYNLLTEANIANSEKKFSPTAYITLDNLISLINDKINSVTKRPVPNYSFIQDNKNVCVGSKLNEYFLSAGPAESFNIIKTVDNTIFPDEFGIASQFAFTTQRNAKKDARYYLALSLLNSTEPFVNDLKSTHIPLQHLILVNVNFILGEFYKILQGDKYLQDKKILSFLKSLFRQLEVNTGGIIDLQITPERDTNGNIISIIISNLNGDPEDLSKNIKPFEIPMMTKGSVVRAMSIESKVPDAVVTEVATFTRAGLNYGEDSNEDSLELTKAETNMRDLSLELEELNNTWIFNVQRDGKQNSVTTRKWNDKVKNIYRKMASTQQAITLNSNGGSLAKYNIFNLKTAIFPIYLKLTLDGINGFLYGNAIKTNWLPKQYRNPRIYWTVTKIRHVIQNNDWTTELEAIYRVKESDGKQT
jgi:hypothetical protein